MIDLEVLNSFVDNIVNSNLKTNVVTNQVCIQVMNPITILITKSLNSFETIYMYRPKSWSQ